MTVSMKLTPADTGMTNVKLAADSALNMTNADTKISTKAPITCGVNKNPIQSFNEFNTFPFSLYFIMAAPATLSKAYKKQNSTAFISLDLVQ